MKTNMTEERREYLRREDRRKRWKALVRECRPIVIAHTDGLRLVEVATAPRRIVREPKGPQLCLVCRNKLNSPECRGWKGRAE